jgi:hypothetical protein
MSTTNDDILKELRQMNARMKFMATIQMLQAHELPGSPYWEWFQKSSATPQIIPAQQGVTLIDDSGLPSHYGYLHSLDIQCSSGFFMEKLTYYSGGSHGSGHQQFLQGHPIDFWLAEFSPRAPISAGDPIVVFRLIDDAAGTAISAQPEWTARVSPSWNVPFSTPFKFELINDQSYPGGTPGAAATIYGYDLYFWMLTEKGERLIEDAEAQGLIFGQQD